MLWALRYGKKIEKREKWAKLFPKGKEREEDKF